MNSTQLKFQQYNCPEIPKWHACFWRCHFSLFPFDWEIFPTICRLLYGMNHGCDVLQCEDNKNLTILNSDSLFNHTVELVSIYDDLGVLATSILKYFSFSFVNFMNEKCSRDDKIDRNSKKKANENKFKFVRPLLIFNARLSYQMKYFFFLFLVQCSYSSSYEDIFITEKFYIFFPQIVASYWK